MASADRKQHNPIAFTVIGGILVAFVAAVLLPACTSSLKITATTYAAVATATVATQCSPLPPAARHFRPLLAASAPCSPPPYGALRQRPVLAPLTFCSLPPPGANCRCLRSQVLHAAPPTDRSSPPPPPPASPGPSRRCLVLATSARCSPPSLLRQVLAATATAHCSPPPLALF
ncbi:uncharacterized protein LOC126267684 [Schistocerca gregaria]|uniref:uncharacterized protein LOC126267684 n=1 Tax=Schistocerca gregaria TaxID=7010 RepID=UPI00211E0E8E|nr:uncharacterized protein LOC126267684 [Schistocerca gregaria]